VDYFPKPTQNVAATIDAAAMELAQKVKTAARARVRARNRSGLRDAKPSHDNSNFKPSNKVVAIGSSTGGVEALMEVLSHFPKMCPATVITQHMPAGFTASFAERLNRTFLPDVCEATDGASLHPGKIYLAPGSASHLELSGRQVLCCRLKNDETVNGHRPSVDVLFQSVARAANKNAIGVLLTGMGRDGAAGLKTMREVGATTIGQDEQTSVVYGMPRAAFEMGAVEQQLPLEKIGPEILRLCAA
jgi:two-component system chemotaxis response regulator CheB